MKRVIVFLLIWAGGLGLGVGLYMFTGNAGAAAVTTGAVGLLATAICVAVERD